jgi:hypothetical protein
VSWLLIWLLIGWIGVGLAFVKLLWGEANSKNDYLFAVFFTIVYGGLLGPIGAATAWYLFVWENRKG